MFLRRRRIRALEAGTEPEEVPMTPMIDIVFQLLIFFMLTMQFKEVEGKLLSQLPKHGTRPIPPSTLREEVRIVICAGGDVKRHVTHKGAHEKTSKDGAECVVRVERHEMGRLRRTADEAGAAAANREVYRETGRRAREIRSLLEGSPAGKPALILDADSEVPYEHVIGVINGLKEAGVHDVEFAANPKHAAAGR